MRETKDDLAAMQALLDRSHAGSTSHLRSIVSDERVLRASEIAGLLSGMRVVTVATVTASGEPRISAMDGHFLHGTWTFGTSGTAAKARHIARRPAVSVAHVDGEDFAVFSHGEAERLDDADAGYVEILDHWTAHYGESPLGWGDDVRLYRLRPTWMLSYASHRAELLAARGIAMA